MTEGKVQTGLRTGLGTRSVTGLGHNPLVDRQTDTSENVLRTRVATTIKSINYFHDSNWFNVALRIFPILF